MNSTGASAVARLLGVATLVLLAPGCRKSASPSATPELGAPKLEAPKAGQAWTNSLEMKFVALPGTNLLVATTETQADVFDQFIKETGTPWVPPDAELGGNFPAANVTWDDAVAFCTWLTAKEGGDAAIPRRYQYRLPSDSEWSLAAGLGAEQGTTPLEKGESPELRYPWGGAWPPPAGSGNFAGEEAEVDQSEPGNFIAGYNDGFRKLAPVGKFKPSPRGLYDLSGNVLEWCADWADDRHQGRVARGGSWLNGDPDTLALNHRAVLAPRAGLNVVGFRCVIEIAP